MNELVWKILNVRVYLRDKDCNYKIKGFLFLMIKYIFVFFVCFIDREWLGNLFNEVLRLEINSRWLEIKDMKRFIFLCCFFCIWVF